MLVILFLYQQLLCVIVGLRRTVKACKLVLQSLRFCQYRLTLCLYILNFSTQLTNLIQVPRLAGNFLGLNQFSNTRVQVVLTIEQLGQCLHIRRNEFFYGAVILIVCLLGRNLFLSNFNRETTDFFLIFRILRHGLRSSQLPTQLCQISRLNAVQAQRIYLRILRNLMLRYGVEVKCGKSAPSVAELKEMGYTHILLATGAWKAGKLDIEGNVQGVIEWMKKEKKQVKPNLSGNIVVVGAGNTAMDAARVAKRMGAHATILYRRTKKFMPADEHELQLAIDEGVEFIELAAPVKQAKGMLLCDKMVLGEPDETGRRSPVKSGEQFSIPCDLVLSAVGEQVDSDLMAANGIEMERKGPAFETNVEGVYCAGDAHRGPATVVEGIADAARFAEAVVGAPYEYEIPAQAFITESDAIAKHGILKMSGKCEGERCLQCSTVCENCVDSCPNRANVAVVMPDESHQIIHVDKMCNECGNCTQFCPYASEPCHDKFTLFQTAEDMAESKNPGVLFLDADHVRVRMAEERDYDLSTSDNDLPVDIEALIFTIRDKYSYLFA